MSPYRRTAALVAAWLGAVVLGSVLVWVAVDSAGRAVLDPSASPAAGSGAATTPAGTTTASVPPSASPSPDAGSGTASTTSGVGAPPSGPAGGSGAGSGAGGSAAGGSGGSAGGGGSGGGSSASGGTSGGAPAPAPTRSAAPAPAPAPAGAVSRVAGVTGGTLAVTCRGDAIELGYATPADGWSVRVEDTGPRRVRVRFEPAGEGEDQRLEATCNGGSPQIAVGDS